MKYLFIIFLLFIILMALFSKTNIKEKFTNNFLNTQDIKSTTFQGVQLPSDTNLKDGPLYGSSGPSIDGSNNKNVPKSMFMLRNNNCSKKNCEIGKYQFSCPGGCIGLSNNQSNFLTTRGNNHTKIET